VTAAPAAGSLPRIAWSQRCRRSGLTSKRWPNSSGPWRAIIVATRAAAGSPASAAADSWA